MKEIPIDILQEKVKMSYSYAEVLRNVDLKRCSYHMKKVKRLIDDNNINHDHFDVRYHLKKRAKRRLQKICAICNKTFTTIENSKEAKYCSRKCANALPLGNRKYSIKHNKLSNCSSCGVEITTDARTGKNRGKCIDCRKSYIHKICKLCGTYQCTNNICAYLNHGALKTIKKFGINIQIGNSILLNESIEKVKIFLHDIVSRRSNFEICYDYDIQPRSLYKLLITFEIRDKSDKVFHTGSWYTTWNGKKVYLRSMLEVRQAKFLDTCEIDYDVESLTIPYKNSKGLWKIYKPDFHIPSKNLVIEIKGKYFKDMNCPLKEQATKDLGYDYKYIVDDIFTGFTLGV